ncbi:MAG: ScyD/ScyE family protein [Anaerolineales bacterium]
MNRKNLLLVSILCCVIILGVIIFGSGIAVAAPSSPTLVASGLEGSTGAGSAVGPDGALYVTQAKAGVISRVDPKSGAVSTFASGLPQAIDGFPIGGVMDVAFIDGTAYALTTLVSPALGGNPSDIAGIYRVDGTNSFTPIADLGQFSLDHPPTADFDYFVPFGVQYTLEPFRDGFLVTDGHLNRVLYVTLDGEIEVVIQFGNTVPTGLAIHGNRIYMAEAGPVPHAAEDGKVVVFTPGSSSATEVGSGAPLLVDVEFGRGRTLFALSQGSFPSEEPYPDPGSAALPDTGSLVRVNDNGTFTFLAEELNQPTSFEIVQNSAYVVTLAGEVWKIGNVANPPFGLSR